MYFDLSLNRNEQYNLKQYCLNGYNIYKTFGKLRKILNISLRHVFFINKLILELQVLTKYCLYIIVSIVVDIKFQYIVSKSNIPFRPYKYKYIF